MRLITQVSGFVAFNPPSCRFLEPIAGTASSYKARYNLRAIQERVHFDCAFHEKLLLTTCKRWFEISRSPKSRRFRRAVLAMGVAIGTPVRFERTPNLEL